MKLKVELVELKEGTESVSMFNGAEQTGGYTFTIRLMEEGVGEYAGRPVVGKEGKTYTFSELHAKSEKEVLFLLQQFFNTVNHAVVTKEVAYAATTNFGRGKTELFASYDDALEFALGSKPCVKQVCEFN